MSRQLRTVWTAITLLSVMVMQSAHAAPIDAFTQATRLGRGVNVLGYDPLWTDASKARFKPPLFRVIHQGGFQTVRVNLQAFAHMDSSNQLDPQWLQSLDTVVKQATDAGLNVILDEHDFHPCAQDAAVCRTKLLAFWSQIAPRYKDAPSSVFFEILNEPNGELTSDKWNSLLSDALTVIRQSNPKRTVVIGPARGNYFQALADLRIPQDDPNIIVTVHYYNPFRFTHQGAPWVKSEIKTQTGVAWGDKTDRTKMYHEFDVIADWATAHHRPILLGEFGAYDVAPMQYRLAWTIAVVNAAEKRHFAWAYWEFEGSFGVYDIGRGQWNEQIHRALVASDHAYIKGE